MEHLKLSFRRKVLQNVIANDQVKAVSAATRADVALFEVDHLL